jgi:tetratricopeptide (TPR) repeat protein
MAQPGITAKIEELQFRIKTDPKSRLFFPLAEELRKSGKLGEAEQVLRTGLGVHPTYLSAWVSLGRVLREQQKNTEAVDALTKALQVDPGNVVAARLLGDSYLDLGEKVEAIKKYKLVHALMPGDEELETRIELLDRELRPTPEPEFVAGEAELPSAEPEPVGAEAQSPFAEPEPPVAEAESPFAEQPEPEPQPEAFSATADLPFAPPESPFDETSPIRQTVETPFDTDDEIPMAAQHVESPFEEPSGYTADALAIEMPQGMHIEEAPLAAEVPAVWSEEPRESEPAADVFAPAEPELSAPDDDLTATTTMAELYVRQGLIEDARKIYAHLLERDPANDELRAKLDALHEPVAGGQLAETLISGAVTEQPGDAATEPPATWQPASPAADLHEPEPGNPATLHSHAKVVVLEQWLAKVAKREPHSA